MVFLGVFNSDNNRMSKKTIILILVLLGAIGLAFGVVKLGWFLPPGGIAADLAQGGGTVLPILVFASALIDSLNPCAISVLLLTIAFLFSLGKNRGKILQVGGVYILGVFLIYIFIGLGIIQVLQFFHTPHFMAKIGAGAIIAWGILELLGELIPRFPIQLKIPQSAHGRMAVLIEKGSLPAALALGVLVGVTEFPCTGGPYLFILGLLHDHASFWRGLGYLLFYNLIFVLPLIIILVIGSDRHLLKKAQEWKQANTRTVRLLMGVVMVALGLLIFQF